VQKDPVRQIIEHIDLIVVRKGEKVVIDVPIHLEGEAAPGTTVNQDANTISLEAEATNIPESVVVSIEGAEDGTSNHAKDFALPAGAALAEDEDLLILNIVVPAAARAEDEETAAAEAAADAEAAGSAE
jgi:large subunit ribosomal protein L25